MEERVQLLEKQIQELEKENKFLNDRLLEMQLKAEKTKLLSDKLSELHLNERLVDWLARRRRMTLDRIKREYERKTGDVYNEIEPTQNFDGGCDEIDA